jgi:hypothetical protein
MQQLTNAISRGLLVMVLFALGGCGSPEKYQKQSEQTPVVAGTAELRLTPELAKWARELTSALDAGKLTVEMGDTLRGVAMTDSVLLLAERVLDTVPDGQPLQKFLLLLIADGYGRSVQWARASGDRRAEAERTGRFAALAARLMARRDSAAAVSPESTASGR